MLSVGDHDFDTPAETVEACVTAVRGGHITTRSFPAFRACARRWRKSRRAAPASQTSAGRGDRHARRPGALYAAVQACSTPATTPSWWRPTTPPIPARSAPPAPTSRRRGARRGRLPAARRGDREGAEAEDAGRSSSTRRTTRPARSIRAPALEGIAEHLPPARSLAAVRRGLLDARRRRACLAARAARHGRAHAGHQLDVEEPRHDRLAHRLADRPGRAHHAADQPQPRHHLRPHRFRLAARRSRRWRTTTASRRSPRSTRRGARSSSSRCAA